MNRKVVAGALLLAPIAFLAVIAARTPPAIVALNKGADATTAGRYDEALRHYDRAIELDPRWAVAHCERGDVLVEMKRYKEAIQSIRECLSLDPAWLEGKASLAIALLLACDYQAAQTALDDLDRAKSSHPRMLENADWVRLRLRRAAELGGRCLSETEIGAL